MKNEFFWESMRVLRSVMSGDAVFTVLQYNNPLVSRLTFARAERVARIASHVASLGVEPGGALHTLLAKCVPMIERTAALERRVTGLATRAEVLALVNSCKGRQDTNRRRVALSLGVTDA
jgi:hypothetical protein